jgi:ATP adenylyltransferase
MNVKNLWAPWRHAYLESLAADAEAASAGVESPAPAPSSFLTDYWEHPENDELNFVVYRNEFGMALLNRYPYASGHLLVALGDPRPRLLDYEPDQRAAFWALVDVAADLVERALNPQGLNIGVNQGKAAGAGVPQHLHAHVVPRWGGDTNFITVVGQIRVMPAALEAMYQRLVAVRDR